MKSVLIVLLSCLLLAQSLAAQAIPPTVVWLEGITAWVSFQGDVPVPLAAEEVFDAAVSPDQTRVAYSLRDGIHIIDTMTRAEVQTLSISIVPPRDDESVYNVFERLQWIDSDQLLFAVGFASDAPMGGIGNVELPYYILTLSSGEAVPFTLPAYPSDFLFSPDGKHILLLANGEIGLPDSAGLAAIFTFPDLAAQGDGMIYYPNYYLDEGMGSNQMLYPSAAWNTVSDMVAFDLTTIEAGQTMESDSGLTSFPSDQVCRMPVGSTPTCLAIAPGRQSIWNNDLSFFVYTPVSEPGQARAPYQLVTWNADNTLSSQPLPTTISNLFANFSWINYDTLLFHTRSQEPYQLYQVTVSDGTSSQLLADAGSIMSVARLPDYWLAIAHTPDGDSDITVSLFNLETQERLTLGSYAGRIGFFEGQFR